MRKYCPFLVLALSLSVLHECAVNPVTAQFFPYETSGRHDDQDHDPTVPKKISGIPGENSQAGGGNRHVTDHPQAGGIRHPPEHAQAGGNRHGPEHMTAGGPGHQADHSQAGRRVGLVNEESSNSNRNQAPQVPGIGHGGPLSGIGSAEGGFEDSKDFIMPMGMSPMGGGDPHGSQSQEHDFLKQGGSSVNQMGQIRNLHGLLEMIEKSSHAVSAAADLAGGSTILLKNVISSMLQGAQQLNLQIETMQRLSSDLNRGLGRSAGGLPVPPELPTENITGLTKAVDELMADFNQVRSSYMSIVFFVPYVVGAIAGTFLMTFVLIVLLCCSMRRKVSKTVSGVKGEWSMQPTRHHASNGGGSSARYEKNVDISYPFAVKKLAKTSK